MNPSFSYHTSQKKKDSEAAHDSQESLKNKTNWSINKMKVLTTNVQISGTLGTINTMRGAPDSEHSLIRLSDCQDIREWLGWLPMWRQSIYLVRLDSGPMAALDDQCFWLIINVEDTLIALLGSSRKPAENLINHSRTHYYWWFCSTNITITVRTCVWPPRPDPGHFWRHLCIEVMSPWIFFFFF